MECTPIVVESDMHWLESEFQPITQLSLIRLRPSSSSAARCIFMPFTTSYRNDVFAFVPFAAKLRDGYVLMHELIGLVWYRIRMLVS